MKKKISIILGSPRKKGNTAALCETLAAAASENEAEVKTVYLSGLNIAPCRACDHCQKEESQGCFINDDMTPLYQTVKKSDVIVFASPVYWFNVSAQLKTFIDRLYAFGTEKNIFKDKEMAAVLCFADDDPYDSGAVNALRFFQDMFRYIGARDGGAVYGTAHKAGEIRKNSAVMEKAAEMGRKLALRT